MCIIFHICANLINYFFYNSSYKSLEKMQIQINENFVS